MATYVTAAGRIVARPPGLPHGTHALVDANGELLYALRSPAILLQAYAGRPAAVSGRLVEEMGADGAPPLIEVVSVAVRGTEPMAPVSLVMPVVFPPALPRPTPWSPPPPPPRGAPFAPPAQGAVYAARIAPAPGTAPMGPSPVAAGAAGRPYGGRRSALRLPAPVPGARPAPGSAAPLSAGHPASRAALARLPRAR